MKRKKRREKKREGFHIRLKVWIEDENGELIMGTGRAAMLEAIERTGSLNRAAKELNMSYRALWERLRKTEARLGRKLLIRAAGGKEGGGSELTPLAKSMMEKFREMDRRLGEEADDLFAPYKIEFLEKKED